MFTLNFLSRIVILLFIGLCLGQAFAFTPDSSQTLTYIADSSFSSGKLKKREAQKNILASASTPSTLHSVSPDTLSSNRPSSAELMDIYKSASSLFVKPEMLDQLMIKLRPYLLNSDTKTDSLLMSTMKKIASGYIANNHFKQAFVVYQQYLAFKENRLKSDLDASVNAANSAISMRQKQEDRELLVMKNTLEELQDDINGYKNKKAVFKTYFSIAIILLSTIIAAMLVSTGLKLNNLRNRLKQNRENLISSHTKSTLGSFCNGLLDSIQLRLNSISKEAKILLSSIKHTSGDKAGEIGKKLN